MLLSTDHGHHCQMFVKDPTMNPHFPPVAKISNCGVYGIWQDDRAITAQLRPQVMQPMLPVPREEVLPRFLTAPAELFLVINGCLLAVASVKTW